MTREEGRATPELADAATLAGDLRDAILARLRNLPDVWRRLPAEMQQREIDAATQISVSLISDMTRLIHGRGRPAIAARVQKINVGKELQISLRAPKDHPLRHALLDAVEEGVLVVIADVEAFFGGAPAAPDPDEPEMPFTPAGGRRPVAGAAKSAGKKAAKPKVDQSAIFKGKSAGDQRAEDMPAHDPETGEINETSEADQ